jgi:hypothetical protein
MINVVTKAPRGLGPAGRKLWHSVIDVFELDEYESSLLLQAARTSDLLEDLQAAIDRDGAMVRTHDGDWKPNPAAIEIRLQRLALARLVVTLRVPSEDEAPRRGSAARGVYRPRVVA